MTRSFTMALGAVVLALAIAAPAGAQDQTIRVTPADGLLDGQMVEISATTTASDYATLALCPAATAPGVGTPVTDLLTTRNICVGLVCLHDGETNAEVAESVAGDCPLSVQPRPISSVATTVALPRVTGDGTDCAVDACVIVFNTWNSGSAQGAVSAPVGFDDPGPGSTTTTADPGETAATPAETTTTTVELSAPSATSTAAPVVSTSTVATEVLGAQEANDGELAVTGVDTGALAAVGLALMIVGGGTVVRAGRAPVSRRPR